MSGRRRDAEDEVRRKWKYEQKRKIRAMIRKKRGLQPAKDDTKADSAQRPRKVLTIGNHKKTQKREMVRNVRRLKMRDA